MRKYFFISFFLISCFASAQDSFKVLKQDTASTPVDSLEIWYRSMYAVPDTIKHFQPGEPESEIRFKTILNNDIWNQLNLQIEYIDKKSRGYELGGGLFYPAFANIISINTGPITSTALKGFSLRFATRVYFAEDDERRAFYGLQLIYSYKYQDGNIDLSRYDATNYLKADVAQFNNQLDVTWMYGFYRKKTQIEWYAGAGFFILQQRTTYRSFDPDYIASLIGLPSSGQPVEVTYLYPMVKLGIRAGFRIRKKNKAL